MEEQLGMSHFHSVKAVEGQGHASTIEIEGVKLAIASRLPLYTLPYFKVHSGMRSPQESSKSMAYSQIDGKMLLKGPTLFDVSHLKRLELQGVSFVLVCDYRDILVLPFVTRSKRFQGTVLLTQPMYYFGKLLLEQFCAAIKNANKCRQSLLEPDYFEESYAYDLFQQRYGFRVEDWQQLYSEADVEAMWQRCIHMNYGQVHSGCGMDIVPYSNGGSMATALWMIQNHRTKFTLVYSDELSVHSWRHCLSAETTRLSERGTIHAVILGSRCLKPELQSTTEELKQFMDDIEKTLRSGLSCTVLVDDLLNILDLADICHYKIQSLYKQMYVYNLLFQAMVKYGNSLVEYLNTYLKGKIFMDPPSYPFSSLESLAISGRISYGNMAKAAIDNRVSLKELQIRHNPTLNFQAQLDQILNKSELIVPTHRKMYDRRATAPELKQWLDTLKPLKVYSYNQVNLPTVQTVEYESRIKLDTPKLFHYQCPNWNGFPVRAFVLANNEFKNPEGKPQSLLVVPKAWQQRLQERLLKQGLETTLNSDTTLTTRASKLSLENYTFCINSTSSQEAALLFKHLTEVSQRIYL